MGRLLKTVTLAIALLFLFLRGPVMADNIDHGYRVNIFTQGAIWGLHTNDLFVRENTDVAYASYVTDITTVMKNGDNRMSLLFSPMTGFNSATNEVEFELNDKVLIDIAIERIDFNTQGRETVNAILIEYDSVAGNFKSIATTSSGGERVFTTNNMRSDGQFTLTEMPLGDLIFSSGQTAGGYRLDFDFSVNSTEIPPFAWEGNAVPLEDTPALRQQLNAAYQNIHAKIAADDFEAVFTAAEPVWARTAFLLTTKDDARSFVEGREGRGLSGAFVASRDDGSALKPLHFWEGPETAALQFMADKRLVRFRPDPIAWEDPAGGNLSYHEFPVVFFRTAEGEWKIGAITTGQ